MESRYSLLGREAKVDGDRLPHMWGHVNWACGYDAGGIKSHYGIRDGFSLWSASSCAAGHESAGSSTYRAVSGVKLASNIACLITVPCSCVFDASPRPSSEKRRVRLKVMQNCLDRQYMVARYVPERTPPHCGCPKHERLENCMRLFVMMCLPLLPVC